MTRYLLFSLLSRRRVRRLLVWAALLYIGAVLVTRPRAQEGAKAADSLVVGDFPFVSVVDGDTVKVKGLDASLRLLAIDTEETFKHDKERKAFARGWESYLKEMRGDSAHPVKMATPLGEDAKTFAEDFFKGVKTVRLERDHPGEIHDYYGRYLAYVLVERDGKWVNYNLEAVRAGMSPYFSKYGISRRFHDQFIAAEAEARAAGRGIWDPKRQHYPDYDERKAWWDRRAAVIRAFEASAPDGATVLTREDALDALAAHVGQRVTLFAGVSEIKDADGRRPAKVLLSRRKGHDFPLVFFKDDVLAKSGLRGALGEYVVVSGKVSRFKDELQIVVDDPAQISTQPEGGSGREPPRAQGSGHRGHRNRHHP